MYALKAKTPRGEIVPVFSKFVKNKNYLLKDTKNPEDKSKKSSLKTWLKAGAIGAGVTAGVGLYNLMKIAKAPGKHVEENMTTAGSIASVPLPIGDVIKRTLPNKSTKKKPENNDK